MVRRLAGKERISMLLIHIRYLLPLDGSAVIILAIHRLLVSISVVVEGCLVVPLVVVGNEVLVFHSALMV